MRNISTNNNVFYIIPINISDTNGIYGRLLCSNGQINLLDIYH